MPNIHPLFVHFPIALLSFYAIFEMARFKPLIRQSWYTPVKCMFLFLGTLMGLLTLQTGEWAAHMAGESALVEVHSSWAAIAIWTFGLLSFCYVLLFVSQKAWFMEHVEARIFKQPGRIFPAVGWIIAMVAPFIALFGFTAIMITGALGGAIVYGPDTDPVVHFIYHLLLK